MSGTPILAVENLHKTFGTVTAAAAINLAVAEAEVVGIIGANGAGKTVFVNMITGYLKPTSGTIRFAGQDITRLAPREITRLGICRSFQVSQVFPTMTVFENVLTALAVARCPGWLALAPIARPETAAEARRILARFRIAHYGDQRAAELSQGVRKLLDIAMASVARPKVLMLDEPTSGISSEEKFAFMETVMQAVAAERASVLIVEHDMDIIARFVSRVLAFAEGEIICDAPPAVAFKDPRVIAGIIGPEGRPALGAARA